MSSRKLKENKNYEVEGTMSEPFDGTVIRSKSDINFILNRVLQSDDVSTNNDELDSCHLRKKAKLMHTSTSPVEAPSDKNNIDNTDLYSNKTNSSNYSDNCEQAENWQPSPSRTYPDGFSARHQNTTEPEEFLINMLRGISDYAGSEDESTSSRDSEPFHSHFRNSGPDLITLHMYTGIMDGKMPVYAPVYKRNEVGRLLKLVRDDSGRWEYVELKKLSEEEIEGRLKLVVKPVKPKAETVSKSLETKKALRRRALADFGLSETQSKGG